MSENINHLKFLSEYDVPFNKDFQNTIIGGLSGIDYDSKKNIYYIISDDRSEKNPARFYEAEVIINQNKIDSVIFLDTKFFKTNVGNVYPDSHNDPYNTPDPEAIRYNPRNNKFVWSSEGERIVKQNKIVLEDPSVTEININGDYIDTLVLPPQLHMQAIESGPRQNSVFEGLTFADNYRTLFVNVEEPLYDDGPRAGLNDSTAIIRILKFDMASKKTIAQYAYTIDAVAHTPNPPAAFKINGVPDILSVGENKLLIIERSFSSGLLACTIKIFLADLSRADNIENIISLKKKGDVKMISKKLLLNMDTLGFYIDNIEGVTFGPKLPNGHRTLLFISDNNFVPIQKTQLLLFEIE
ncbi:MAG: esterase-like activity of phytase family protein [Ginsengibacter sp.]